MFKNTHKHTCTHACTHTQQGETGSLLTLQDWSLFPSLSLPAEILLTKGEGGGGGGLALDGGGDVCAALLSLGEGEPGGRDEGASGGSGGREG